MAQTLVAVVVAPLLTAASTVAARRWGPRVGGVVSAFPAIVGPVLLILTFAHGPAFAARAASGTLLGLVGLGAFAFAYGRIAGAQGGWRLSLTAAWAAAAVASVGVGAVAGSGGSVAGCAAAAVSLTLAHRALPRTAGVDRAAAAERSVGIPVRMAGTAALVLMLSAAAGVTGPVIGGMLAALPVLASILTVLCHREAGAAATVALLRGMLAGMTGFVVFCEAVALFVTAATIPAFLAATAAAVTVQAAVATLRPSSR